MSNDKELDELSNELKEINLQLWKMQKDLNNRLESHMTIYTQRSLEIETTQKNLLKRLESKKKEQKEKLEYGNSIIECHLDFRLFLKDFRDVKFTKSTKSSLTNEIITKQIAELFSRFPKLYDELIKLL